MTLEVTMRDFLFFLKHITDAKALTFHRIDREVQMANGGSHLEMDCIIIKTRHMTAESNTITNHKADKPSQAITVQKQN